MEEVFLLLSALLERHVLAANTDGREQTDSCNRVRFAGTEFILLVMKRCGRWVSLG